ncbi:hypothetical protein [Mesorhizobium zhangyense]|nr:hypothetical protein [Mesorhizobium zhangyense]
MLAPVFYTSFIWPILFGNLPDAWPPAGAATTIVSGLYALGRRRQ